MPKKRFSHIVGTGKPVVNFTKDNVLFHHMINGAVRLLVAVDKSDRVSDFVVLDANSAWEKLTGRKRTEVIGRRIGALFPGMGSRLLEMAQRVMNDKKGRYFEYFSNLFDRWFQMSVFPTAPRECIMIFSDITEIKRDVTSLRQAEKEREDQNRLLLEKNIALREVMAQLDNEKKNIAEKVRTNMERLVLPILARIRPKCPQELAKYLQLLEENLHNITSGFGTELSHRMTRLTQQEIEICDMIRQGLRCKEIASLLNITVRTAETHRAHIRKKLGINDPGINLVTFLKNIERTTY